MPHAHPWDLSPADAIALQQQLRQHVRLTQLAHPPRLIAGVDLSYEIRGTELWAAIVVFAWPGLVPVGYAGVHDQMRFPYVPGLLSFREVPALMQAWALLPTVPDLILTDGHGIAHPRRLGIASHLGLLTGVATIGCAKNVLTGHFAPPEAAAGSYTPILEGEEILGYALRTRSRVKPVFVSPGHGIDLAGARTWAWHCAGGYRLPEPTRQAHLTVNALRRGERPVGQWVPA